MSRRKPSIAKTVDTLSIGGLGRAHPKNQRLKSKKNLNYIKGFDCFICGRFPTDPDHFRSRGAGGGDELSNLNSLCRHHHIERHSLGVKRFWDRYSSTIIMAREKYDLPPLEISFILT